MAVYGAVVVALYDKHLTHGLQTSDADAPVFATGPTAGVVTSTSIQVTGTITDATPPVVVYAVVVADAAGAPSSAQIQAGTDSLNAAAPNDNDTVAVSGGAFALNVGTLTAGTAYDLYYVAVDDSANESTPAKLDFTTSTPYTPTGTATIASIVKRRRRKHG